MPLDYINEIAMFFHCLKIRGLLAFAGRPLFFVTNFKKEDMKEKILALLIAKFKGVSEQILSRIATNIAKTATTDEEVTTAVEGATLQSVIDSQADYRANEATVNAVTNYENKHGLKDGQKKTTGGESTTKEPNPEGNNGDTPPWAKTLIEQNKTLSDKVAAMEGAKVTDTRKQKLNTIIANLPEHLQKPYHRMSIDSLSNEEFDALTTEVTAEVGVIEAGVKTKGSVFQLPLGGGDASSKAKPTTAELEDVTSQLKL